MVPRKMAGLVPVLALTFTACAPRVALEESKLIDLTYAFDAHTVYWPAARCFELKPAPSGL